MLTIGEFQVHEINNALFHILIRPRVSTPMKERSTTRISSITKMNTLTSPVIK